MKFTITLEEILKYNPCKSGIDPFKKEYGGSVEINFTTEKQVEICTSVFKESYQWAIGKNLVPQYNLSNATLSNADLRGANLSNAIGVK